MLTIEIEKQYQNVVDKKIMSLIRYHCHFVRLMLGKSSVNDVGERKSGISLMTERLQKRFYGDLGDCHHLSPAKKKKKKSFEKSQEVVEK